MCPRTNINIENSEKSLDDLSNNKSEDLSEQLPFQLSVAFARWEFGEYSITSKNVSSEETKLISEIFNTPYISSFDCFEISFFLYLHSSIYLRSSVPHPLTPSTSLLSPQYKSLSLSACRRSSICLRSSLKLFRFLSSFSQSSPSALQPLSSLLFIILYFRTYF